MTRISPLYEVREGDIVQDRTTVLRLWDDKSPSAERHQVHDGASKYQWFYHDNPAGHASLFLLWHVPTHECVGVVGVAARQLCLGEAQYRVGVLVDFVVTPRHRTLYPAVLLQGQVSTQGLARNLLLYGLPNTRAVAIFRHLGYPIVREMRRYVRILRIHAYLERMLPRWTSMIAGPVADALMRLFYRWKAHGTARLVGAWTDCIDARIDALWQSHNRYRTVIGVRDSRFLQWRFTARPGRSYRIFTVSKPGTDRLTAYFVCETKGPVLFVRDFLCECGGAVLAGALIQLSDAAHRMGYTSISLEAVVPPDIEAGLDAAGFVERGSRSLFVAAGEDTARDLSEWQWFITSADEDI